MSTQVGAKPGNKNEHIFEKKGGTSNEESIKSTKKPIHQSNSDFDYTIGMKRARPNKIQEKTRHPRSWGMY
jgi:hypothetical protein